MVECTVDAPEPTPVPLKDFWYIAAESRQLKGKPLARAVFGERLVLFRGPEGEAAALQDRCAHRNLALSQGTVKEGRLECSYHGWTYDGTGACVQVPSMGCRPEKPAVSVRRYPVAEKDGYVWVYPGEIPPKTEPYRFAHYGEPGWTSFTMQNRFEGAVESCLENFLDCPHTVFVHKGWFRTKDPRPLKATVRRREDSVEVEFEDEPISPSVVSKLLFPADKPLKHTDRFLMPSVSRVDYSFGPDRHFIITSQCTPVSEYETMVYTVINFRFGSIGPLVRLAFEPLCRRIIAQDVDVIARQTENLRRFGGQRFTHLETDVIGPHITALRQRCERGGDAAGLSLERDVVIRF